MLHHVRAAFVPFAVAALISGAPTVSAKTFRLSYVSLTGNDHNACSLAAPCRTLTHAIAVTTEGGEVRVINSAGYGPTISIGKSITVSGDGATIFAGPITIDNASAVVTLRDLTLYGGGSPGTSNGVTITAANTVHIEHCTIHGFSGRGIEIRGNGVDVFVTDSTMRDNRYSGLRVFAATAARLTVANSHFDANNRHGLTISNGDAVIDHSSASGNFFDGIDVYRGRATVTSTVAAHNGSSWAGIEAKNGADVTVEFSVMRGNGTGLTANYNSTVRISNSVVTQNAFGVNKDAGSTVFTRQNNTVSGNGTDVSGTLTPLGGL